MISEKAWNDCLAGRQPRTFASLEEWRDFLNEALGKAGAEPPDSSAWEQWLAELPCSAADPLAYSLYWQHCRKLLLGADRSSGMAVFVLKQAEGRLVCVAGSANATAAASLSQQLQNLHERYPDEELVFDLVGLDYISSAGLRSFLKLLKTHKKIRLTDVSAAAYEVFNMTGMDNLIPTEKAMRRLSVRGCTKLSEGANGEVYRLGGDAIIKVYKQNLSLEEIRAELDSAKAAFRMGLPTALSFDIVRVGDRYGAVYEMLQAKTIAELLNEQPEKLAEYAGKMVEIMKSIHAVSVTEDTPGMGDKQKDWMLEYLRRDAPYLPENSTREIEDWLKKMPDSDHVVHGDCHAKNLMADIAGDVFIIDMDSMGRGQPLFEFAALYASYIGYLEVNGDTERQFSITGIMSVAMEKQLWDSLLHAYFPTEAERRSIEAQSALLAYLRIMSHYIKKHEQGAIETCQSLIAGLLPAWRETVA